MSLLSEKKLYNESLINSFITQSIFAELLKRMKIFLFSSKSTMYIFILGIHIFLNGYNKK